MPKSVTITNACNTVQGDRFRGDQYTGDGAQSLVNLGVAVWNEDPIEEKPSSGGPDQVISQSGEGNEGRTYCQIEDCRKYKTEPCPRCKQPTCPDHMDDEAGMCVACVQEINVPESTGGAE